ncbi:MAG: ABC transporter permease [Clostridia bacterium]|nr:ABC transporter permease [Clostridia bacterium]
MYLNILKRDLKRKKTMNVILLIFVMLSAMFMASSVNNIIAVTSGLDFFFEKAGMSDFFVIEMSTEDTGLQKAVKELDSVSDCRKEPLLLGNSSDIAFDEEKKATAGNSPLYCSVDDAQLNIFNQKNEVIKEVEKGTVYVTSSFASSNNVEIGDKLTVTVGESKVELKYMGKAKDAFLGSNFLGNCRFIMNDEDFQHLNKDESAKERSGNIYYIDTTDVSAVKATIGEFKGVTLNETAATMKNTYLLDMIVAALLLVVGVFLIIVSFVVLKHTIGFTIAEEFREIGVMKAIGMKNSSIRILYLIKYFAITVIGSALGFVLSVPFSYMMLKSVSESMYLESENSIIVGLLGTLLVVGLTMFFCWNSTSKIKKLTPIDAVRNGQTGERFRKKSLMHLSKSKLSSTTFLAANDIVSAPKKYSVITAVFAILIMLVMVLANTANTLKSENTLTLIGCIASDAYILSEPKSMEEIEEILAENDMPGTVREEKVYSFGAIIGDEKTTLSFQHSADTNAADYVYGEGVAPENENEISISYVTAEEFSIGIGDEITLVVNGEEMICMVTALHQTMNMMGKVNRLHQDFDVSSFESTSSLGYQIDFDEELTNDELNERIEILRGIFGEEDVKNSVEMARDTLGAAETMEAVKNLTLVIVLFIVVLVAVLMERSFISSEKAEIAILKAIGFSNKSIIWHHTLRFAMVALIASLVAAALCLPATHLAIDPIFEMMGAVSGVGYEIVPLEIFLIYPAILVAVTIISAFFTSIYTNTIKSSDASNIE